MTKPSRCDVPPEPHASGSRRNLVDESSVLVIATVPCDEDHVRALGANLSASRAGSMSWCYLLPSEAKPLWNLFRDEVLQVLRHLNDVTVHYFRNNRYDVGQRVTRCLFWSVPIQQTPSPLPTRYS